MLRPARSMAKLSATASKEVLLVPPALIVIAALLTRWMVPWPTATVKPVPRFARPAWVRAYDGLSLPCGPRRSVGFQDVAGD